MKIHKTITASTYIDWDSLSASDQMTVEFALDYRDEGYSQQQAILEAMYRVAEGNSSPEYVDEEWYQEEPDARKVKAFIVQEYGNDW